MPKAIHLRASQLVNLIEEIHERANKGEIIGLSIAGYFRDGTPFVANQGIDIPKALHC